MFEIIDFHTHPFLTDGQNICNHKAVIPMTTASSKEYLQGLAIHKICGSVVSTDCYTEPGDMWKKIQRNNASAYALQERYGDFYIPGIHVHPLFVKESCEEIEKAAKAGVRLIGELVPYLDGWKEYDDPAFLEILDVAEAYHMVVSFHSSDEDKMDNMVKSHPDLTFVAAHPGEYSAFMRHLERMKHSENYHLDLSGTGLFRHGLLKRAVDTFGAERIVFGSDFPICNPAMFIGGVMLETLITDRDKEKIFSLNAKRILQGGI